MKTERPVNRLVNLVLLGCVVLGGCSDSTDAGAPDVGIAGDGTLAVVLEHVRSQHDLPALAAIMIRGDAVVETAAVGVRAVGHPENVTVDDRWHVGSITKSMTATLAARLVEQGVTSWATTIADVFPDLAGSMRAEYRDVRLDELLSHTSGLRRDADYQPFRNGQSGDPITLQRRQLTADVLALAPEVSRGTFLYSNAGFIVAGAMLEEVMGTSWEQLIAEHVFTPLAMSSTSFGAPGTAGQRDQPWGHEPFGDNWIPIEPGVGADNAAVLGPAGTVHGTLSDLARYAAAHLAGARGSGGLISSASFAKLHTPIPGTEYALGWIVRADGELWHNGSNTLWYAEVFIVPGIDGAWFCVTNAGPGALVRGRAAQGVGEVARLLEQRFGAAFGGGD